MTMDKKTSADHFFTRCINSFFLTIKRLFKGLFSFAQSAFLSISGQNPYISGLRRVKAHVPLGTCALGTGAKAHVPNRRGAGYYLLLFVTVLLIVISFVVYLPKARSAGVTFNQTDWSGGAQEGAAATAADWSKFESADEGVNILSIGDLTLSLIDGQFEDTTSDEFNQGALSTTVVVAEGSVSLSHPVRLNEYTVGALSKISVNVSTVRGYDPWTVSFSGNPDLSRIFKSDKFTDVNGRSYKILSISDVKDTIIVIDSEGLATAPSAGAATVGRWFTTLAAWESAREGDITANGRNAIERALCYYDGAPDTSTPTIDGWITDEDHTIEVTVPARERHTGVWTPGAYTLSTTSNAPNLFVHADYTKVRGLQVESQSEGRHYAVRVAAAGVEVTDNIIKGANMASMKNWNFGILLSEDSDANVANNIIYHFKSAGKKGRGIVGGKNSDACVYNNTIYGCDVGLDRGLGGGTWITQNNISYRNKNNFHGEFEATSRNNLSGPVEGGAPGLKAVNKTFVDFLDEDGLDFHLNALDAHARNGGANLITDELFAFAQDIDGDPRAKPWDIGADESGASAVITHSIGASARDFATLQAWEDAREGDLTKRHVFRTVRQSNAFTDGETVTNTSGASGTYVKERDIPSAGEKVMTLDGVTGMFSTGDKLTGGASGATATLEMALAASGVIERGEAHMDAVFTEGVVIDGSTTDAGHYMVLTAAPRSRHIGRAGTGAIIDMQGKKADAITVDDDYARVEGLEVSNWGGAHAAVKVESGADGIVVRHMIIHDNDAASAGSNDIPVAINLTNDTGLMRAANNIIYNIANKNAKKGVGIMLLTSTATRIESNVIYNAAGAGLDTNQSRAVIVENNIAAGNGEDFTGKYAAASDYNISSDGSAPGANALNDRAVADIAFISTDAGAEDLGTMIGSAAREITAALSLDSSDDAVARAARYSAAWHAGDDAWFPSFAAGYHNAGIFVSRVHDTKQRPFYMTLSWNANIPIGASLVIRVRTGDHPELAGATEWKECPILVTNENVDIARLISVSDGARYVQYRAELISDDGTATPVLEDVTVTYKGYPLDAKELVSSAFDTGIKGNVITRLSWEETIHKGIDGVNIQLRSAPDENGAPGLWSDWLGPKGAEDYYADMTKSVVINPAHQDGIDDQWVQYKARLFTIGLATPVLSGINIVFGGDLTGLEIPSETQPEPTAAEPEPEPVDPQTVTGLTSEEQAALEAAVDKFVEASPDDGTRLYDVVVKLGDNYNSDPGEDARASYKEGDVVVIRPSGHLWSVIERNGFLIIRAYLTEDESRQLTLPQEIVTGEKDEDGRSVKEMVKRRANRIDLTKLGLSKRSDTGKRALKLRALRGTLKAKALKRGLIEEK